MDLAKSLACQGLTRATVMPAPCNAHTRPRSYAHVALEALQGAANRLDAFGGDAVAAPERPTA